MNRSSLQDQDGVVWQTAGLPLGSAGLDLRNPAAPGALTKLLNARFRDDATLERREGHRGLVLQDGGDFAPVANTPGGWVYGHGRLLSTEGPIPNRYPIAQRGAGIFRLDGADVAWTGDRLLVVRDDQPASLGASTHWTGAEQPWGIPAYLPVQTDSTPPDVVSGDHIETCLTETLRVFVGSSSTHQVIAWVVDRATGTMVNRTILDSGSAIHGVRVVNSGGIPLAFWRDGNELRISWWSGSGWSETSLISGDCDAFDVQPVPDGDGCALLYRDSGDVRVGRYLGRTTDNLAFAFGTIVPIVATTGAIAFSVAPDEGLAFVYQRASDGHLWASFFDATMAAQTDLAIIAEAGPYTTGLTACHREIDRGGYPLVVHAGSGVRVTLLEVTWNITPSVTRTAYRYRSHVASKSWRVGDEVFCWLRARNSETNYLVAGVTPLVCGVADREEAKLRAVDPDGTKALAAVSVDPLDEYAWTWARPFTTTRVITVDDDPARFAETYARAGNARVGDLQFLPDFCAVQFGESTYVAGSLVRNWDGIELGDAGFHDYPLVSGLAESIGAGSLAAGGTYRFRVYPVRYNKRGERFQGPAITSSAITLTGPNNTVTLTIDTLPLTNHADVWFEVYRTENGGTTYYLDGVVANSLAADTVSYVSTTSDTTLRTRAADPHAAGIGALSEIEELGPVGCSMLAVTGDRLWGAGGQVPAGTVQFSKLKEPGEGAGFDALAGTLMIDTQGAPVTSIVGFGDGAIFFQANRIQLVTNAGPDNYGLGSFGIPQIVLADGAITHRGTAVVPIGVVYWGADGPRLLTAGLQVEQICAPVRELSKDLSPTGVQVNLARQEAVWFTAGGTALLWSFRSVESRFQQLTSLGRWAQWSGLSVAGCSPDALITPDGRILYADEDALGDAGVPFAFAGATGYIAPGSLLGGSTMVRSVGVVGEYLGEHILRVLVSYNGAAMWTDRWEWDPDEETGLISGTLLAGNSAAQMDALGLADRSGAYATHKRTSRQACRHFKVEWTDVASFRPTYRLNELTFELGGRGGLGRVPVNTFSSAVNR